MSRLLEILNLRPSAQSVDYVENKQQFHLFSLLTEQRHPKTWNLSSTIRSNTEAGLRMLLSVDEDISDRIQTLCRDCAALEQAVAAVVEAIRTGHRIYFYGCGATGRLAKQMESTFWRPFWRKVKRSAAWQKLKARLPKDIEERLTGEMTGGDRALVSSLEAFEDLQLIGRLQLQDHGIRRGDVVFAVTEGGETSSVIGTILGALDQWGPLERANLDEVRRHLYFVNNNPDEVLRPFARSASVLDNPAITRINLTTGPQAISGSTRLQATTIETFVLGAVLEEAVYRMLREHLPADELAELGFGQVLDLKNRLASFDSVKGAVDAAAPDMARFTSLETDTYSAHGFATYFALAALITVFIDNTERSPTFRLYPLDRADEKKRKCWTQVWTEASDSREAWNSFLGRGFRGLDSSFYRPPFQQQIADPYLREGALRSLANAGNDQEALYDFSFSESNVETRGPRPGDMGVLVLMGDEVQAKQDSTARRFMDLFDGRGGKVAVLALVPEAPEASRVATGWGDNRVVVRVRLPGEDPLTLRGQMALKMLLNAHSTGVMAALGRVIGNTMTNVNPSNLKLVGRATSLILTHVNDTLGQQKWVEQHGRTEPVSFAEANALLFDAMDYVQSHGAGQTSEVALSIVRAIEALNRSEFTGWDQASGILDREGLDAYLSRNNPALLQAKP